MTVISTIIRQAYRESNMLALKSTPTTEQVAEALYLLNNLFLGIYGNEAGETLRPWPLGSFGRQTIDAVQRDSNQIQNPPKNFRLVASNEAAITVYFVPQPDDGARYEIVDPFMRLANFPVTLNGNGYPFDNAAQTQLLNTAGLTRTWMFRADMGIWVQVSDKTETDEMPFPRDFDDMFMIELALRLNPRYGRMIDDQSLARQKNQMANFRARYIQVAPLEIDDSLSWPFMSRQTFDNSYGYSSIEGFDRGIVNNN